jgi:RNase P subunit RPR2
MERKVVCPSCQRVLPDSDVISDANKGEGSYLRQVVCECGEKITYWQIKALIRSQETFKWRFQNWIRSLS